MLPTFMPVATQAAIKGLTSQQMEALGITLILNNTYHLNLRPGVSVLEAAGGAHRFQGWTRNLLTDSGGFQLVSLAQFTKITEEGALFASPFTGEPTMLTVSIELFAYGHASWNACLAGRKHHDPACYRSGHYHATRRCG